MLSAEKWYETNGGVEGNVDGDKAAPNGRSYGGEGFLTSKAEPQTQS